MWELKPEYRHYKDERPAENPRNNDSDQYLGAHYYLMLSQVYFKILERKK